MYFAIIILCILQPTWQKGYYRTEDVDNLAWDNWNKQSIHTNVNSKIECGAICEARNQQGMNCNAWKFHNSICETGRLSYLKEYEKGQERLPYYVEDTIQPLYKYCHGGDNCCNTTNGCRRGGGDCDVDEDCWGIGLVCGDNNCPTNRGGLWDAEDDCCTQRCKVTSPCSPGEGTCTSDEDCLNPDFNKCELVESCVSSTYFPWDEFPNNKAMNYEQSDHCCRRRCYPNNLCSHGSKGCKDNNDCLSGLACNESDICEDIDECLLESSCFSVNNSTLCMNSISSFTCYCKLGFTMFVSGIGCSDINECTFTLILTNGTEIPNGWNTCGENTECINTIGDFYCECKVGYEGNLVNPYDKCEDIDECADPAKHPNCKENSECKNTPGNYTCDCLTGFEGN